MKILIFTCDSITGECFQEQHFGREGKQEWAEGEGEIYTVTTQSTDSLRMCESGSPFRVVPFQSKGVGFCYLSPVTITKQLLVEGCFLMRQLTLSETSFWRAISNQH